MRNELTDGDIDLLFQALKAYEQQAAGDIMPKVMISRMMDPQSDPETLSKRVCEEVRKTVANREQETIFLKAKLLRLRNFVAEHPVEATPQEKGAAC